MSTNEETNAREAQSSGGPTGASTGSMTGSTDASGAQGTPPAQQPGDPQPTNNVDPH